MHRILKIMLKRNGKVLGEMVVARMGAWGEGVEEGVGEVVRGMVGD